MELLYTKDEKTTVEITVNCSKYWFKYQTFIINKLSIKEYSFKHTILCFHSLFDKTISTVITPSSSNVWALQTCSLILLIFLTLGTWDLAAVKGGTHSESYLAILKCFLHQSFEVL